MHAFLAGLFPRLEAVAHVLEDRPGAGVETPAVTGGGFSARSISMVSPTANETSLPLSAADSSRMILVLSRRNGPHRGKRSVADILSSELLFGSEYLTYGRDQRLRSERFLK